MTTSTTAAAAAAAERRNDAMKIMQVRDTAFSIDSFSIYVTF